MILGSDSAPSWNIRPQIEGLEIKLEGAKVAALQYSAIRITFIPVMPGNTMKLEAVYPTGFDFSDAIVNRPRSVVKRATEGHVIAVDGLRAFPDQECTVKIMEVRLGRGGGQTVFHMFTYNDTEMDIVRDERFQFDEGFRLPGALHISEKSLSSMYQEQADRFPVRALFPATVDEQARAAITFSLTQGVKARERLIITSFGPGAYTLMPDGFVLLGRDLVDNALELTDESTLTCHLGPNFSPQHVILQAETPYSLSLWVYPRLGDSMWRIETRDDAGIDPTNTNDGLLETFLTVSPIQYVLNTQIQPPMAVIVVSILVSVPTKPVVVEENDILGESNMQVEYIEIGSILVIAPAGFEWQANCGKICTPSQPLGASGRQTALLRHGDGRTLNSLLFSRIDLRVKTPAATPPDMFWFIEAKDKNDQTIGWGEDPGFEIEQMNAYITFPSVSNLDNADFAVVFTMTNPGGAQIRLVPPRGYKLQCSEAPGVNQMNLPGDQPPTCLLNDPLT